MQQPLFCQGILAILRAMTGCEIVGQPASVGEVLEVLHTCQPSVALLDTLSGAVDIVEIAQYLRTYSPHTAVIVLAGRAEEEWLFQAMKIGAAAYMTRDVTPDELLETIRRVSQSEYLTNGAVFSASPGLPCPAIVS